MKQKFLHLGMAMALVASAAPCAVLAKDSAAATASGAKSLYSVDSRIADLLRNPQAAQVLQAFVQKKRVEAGKPELTPEQESHMIQMVQEMSPRQVAKFPQVHLDDAALDQLNAQLAEVSAATSPSAG
jgi:hypothetical protein